MVRLFSELKRKIHNNVHHYPIIQFESRVSKKKKKIHGPDFSVF